MFKINHEPQESGFNAKSFKHFMVYKSILTIEDCHQFVFYNNMEKARAKLALFSVE